MNAYEQVVDALRANGRHVIEHGTDRATAQCPAHDDNSPSLSIAPRKDGGGVILHCHAGCDYLDVLDAIGLTPADLFDNPRERSALPPVRPVRRPPPDPVVVVAQNHSHIDALTTMFGSVANAGRALALCLADADPLCRWCRTGEVLGGSEWWRGYCADCATGWVPQAEVDAAVRWNATKQAAVAISQAEDWSDLRRRIRGRK